MQDLLRNEILEVYGKPVNSPKTCDELSATIFDQTGRKISATTLRRFFGLLPSKSSFSTFVLDTLAIYCGSKDFRGYCKKQTSFTDYAVQQRDEIILQIEQITDHTLGSISRKSLIPFQQTIPRKNLEASLNGFVASELTIYPIVAPGGYGKSIALAHWVRSQLKENTCLFCSASILFSMLDPGKRIRNGLQFNLSSWNNVLNVFINDTHLRDRKFLLVIDDFDELILLTQGQLATVTDFYFDVASRFGLHKKIKIVFCCSESFWKTHLDTIFKAIDSMNWYKPVILSPVSGFTNIPELSNSEIREIIDQGNLSKEQPIIYECIPWDIREMMKIPFSIQLVSMLYKHHSSIDIFTQNDVIHEYIREVIYHSRFAEQKEDLVWKILELGQSQEVETAILKSNLKEHYPIHLRREKAYYHAYGDLLQKGIITEYREENKYGINEIYVDFKHRNFYYYLSAVYRIKRDAGLKNDLFKTIVKSSRGINWISNMVATLFQIAYDHEDLEILRDFCTLPENIVGSLTVRLAVGRCFRKENSIRNPLITEFASCETGRIYFFEQYVDTNYIFNNYTLRIREYLKNKRGTEALLFGNSIHFLASLLKMDRRGCSDYAGIMQEIEPDGNVHPWPIGRKVFTHFLHHVFIEGKGNIGLKSYLGQYRKIAYSHKGYLQKGLVEFEMYIMIALVLIQEHQMLFELLESLTTSYNLSNPDYEGAAILKNNQNSIPMYFLEFARYKLNSNVNEHPEIIWENGINNYTTNYDDYQYLILLNWFLYDFYSNQGEVTAAISFYNSALELSRFASYEFYETLLLNNDPSGDPDPKRKAQERIRNSGFHPDSFKFMLGPCAERCKPLAVAT